MIKRNKVLRESCERRAPARPRHTCVLCTCAARLCRSPGRGRASYCSGGGVVRGGRRWLRRSGRLACGEVGQNLAVSRVISSDLERGSHLRTPRIPGIRVWGKDPWPTHQDPQTHPNPRPLAYQERSTGTHATIHEKAHIPPRPQYPNPPLSHPALALAADPPPHCLSYPTAPPSPHLRVRGELFQDER